MDELVTGTQYQDCLDIENLKAKLYPMDVIEGLGINYSYDSGNWLMCHCPFSNNHSNGDQVASFGFNKESLNYNCFVCGGGSLLSLVQTLRFCTKQEALSWITNLATGEYQSSDQVIDKVNKILFPVVKDETSLPVFSSSHYSMLYEKKDNWSANIFLHQRKISPEIREKFHIGFDKYHYGITIPHYFDGELRGWQIRHLVEEDGGFYCDKCNNGGKSPKYKSTPNFPKLSTLYLYDEICDNDVIVVESPMSALYLWSLGITNVVATFGSFSLQQAELLKKFTKVRIWPDNDQAGAKNLYRVLDELRKATDVVIVPVVDKHKGDAGDVGPENIYNYIFSAYPPTVLPLFKKRLPTLDQVKTVL